MRRSSVQINPFNSVINFEEIFEDNEFEDLGEIFGNEFNPFQFASNYQMNF
jgi:hypothetical protein